MIQTFIPELHVGRPKMVGALTVFPLWTDSPAASRLVVGADADLAVSEVEGGPHVNLLHVENCGGLAALLFEGELLEGGWQSRVVAEDMIVAANHQADVAVACVEAHRWSGDTAQARTGRQASPSVRAALTGVTRSPVQNAVWDRVAAYEPLYGASPTASYLDMERAGTAPLHPVQYRTLPGQRGVVIGVGGYPVLAELFPSTRALSRYVNGLLTSVSFDASLLPGVTEPVPSRRCRRLVARFEEMPVSASPVDEDGEVVRWFGETEGLVMRGLQFADRWAHITVFNRRHELVGV
jgi:ARG/rhodanese/phosphatase superfamily protein